MPTSMRGTGHATLGALIVGTLTTLTWVPAYGTPPHPDFSLASIRSGATTDSQIEVGSTVFREPAAKPPTPTISGKELAIRVVESAGDRGVANLSLADTGSPAAIAVGHDDGVTISWDAESQASHYVVSRGDEKVAQVKGGVFVDVQAPTGRLLTYRVEPVTVGGVFAVSHGIDIVRPAQGNAIPAAADMVQLAEARFQSWVTWKSFIRQPYLDSPGSAICDYSTEYKFGGDNRGFNNGYPYRTMLQAVINWNNGGSLSYQKGIGPTKVYRKSDNALVATKTASSSKLTVQRLAQSTGTRVELYFTKHATNPFCTKLPNAIEGYLRVAVTRAGGYSVLTGQHLQMPAHEIYVGDQNTKTVYTRSEASVLCLQKIVCTAAYITGSGSYS